MKKTALAISLSLFTLFISAQSLKPVEDKSTVKFVIKNFGIGTGGSFNGLQGTIKFDPNNPGASQFDMSVDASTIDTDIAARDNHLRKSEYFDVKTFPRITFRSTRVSRSNNAEYLFMFGQLTIKGVTKEIQFPFKATAKDGGYLFEGDFKLNRRDFGLGGKSLSLSDELEVDLKVFAKG
jgi:polyisoprenoid-binding protein YceI